MTAETTHTIDERDWDALVQEHPAGTIYHTTHWARAVTEAFGVRPFWSTIKNSSGTLIGGVPVGLVESRVFGRKLSSFPCAQYCDPLLPPGVGLDAILESLGRLRADIRASQVELRVRAPRPVDGVQEETTWSHCTHEVDLSMPEPELLRTFHKSCIQRPIARAERCGLQLVVGKSESDARYFYRLYVLMRKAKGLLPAPYSFFSALWKWFVQDDSAEFLHAVSEGRIVSSVLILYFANTATYEYGATTPGAAGLHPSQFLLWEAMKRGKSRGCTVFNLGRTDRDNAGLLLYKQRWGSRLVPLAHLDGEGSLADGAVHPLRSALSKGMKAVVTIMPAPACVWLGDMLYAQTL